MTPEEMLDELERATADVEGKGLKVVEVANLKKFNQLIRGLHDEDVKAGRLNHEARLEQYRTELSNWLEDRNREHEATLELFRTVSASGQSALKTTLIVNGGAAVALLAFAGHIVDSPASKMPVRGIADAMAAFVCGVFASALATGLTYMNNLTGQAGFTKWSTAFNLGAMLAGTSALGCFCWGGYLAYHAIVAQ